MPRVRTKSPAHQSPTPSPSAEPTPVEASSLALSMIQALIPLGLRAVDDALQQEVLALAGPRYAHADGRPAIARWRTSDQTQRWCAATLLEIEKQFRKVKGHQHLALLQAALRDTLSSPLAAA